jgi:hypothetical protein
MVEWNDPRVVVAIYAAVVATTSLAWNIIVSIKNSKRSIKVKVKHQMVFAGNHLIGKYSPAIGALEVQATNYTNEDVYIKSWSIKANKKIDIMGVKTDEFFCLDLKGTIKYPYLLRKGEIFKDSTDVRTVIDTIGRKISPNSKMQIYVYDTFENKFKSKTFKYQSILNLLEAENMDLKKHHGQI